MKKIRFLVAAVIVLTLAFSFAGCKDGGADESGGQTEVKVETAADWDKACDNTIAEIEKTDANFSVTLLTEREGEQSETLKMLTSGGNIKAEESGRATNYFGVENGNVYYYSPVSSNYSDAQNYAGYYDKQLFPMSVGGFPDDPMTDVDSVPLPPDYAALPVGKTLVGLLMDSPQIVTSKLFSGIKGRFEEFITHADGVYTVKSDKTTDFQQAIWQDVRFGETDVSVVYEINRSGLFNKVKMKPDGGVVYTLTLEYGGVAATILPANVIVRQKLAAPQNLAADETDEGLSLSWDAVTNAADYSVLLFDGDGIYINGMDFTISLQAGRVTAVLNIGEIFMILEQQRGPDAPSDGNFSFRVKAASTSALYSQSDRSASFRFSIPEYIRP